MLYCNFHFLNNFQQDELNYNKNIQGIDKLMLDNLAYKINKHSWFDFERTQEWPNAYCNSPAVRITKVKYFKNIEVDEDQEDCKFLI